jgi:hypothetical protein
MSLAIDIHRVAEVLLADGWHIVASQSFDLEAYEYIEGILSSHFNPGGQVPARSLTKPFQKDSLHPVGRGARPDQSDRLMVEIYPGVPRACFPLSGSTMPDRYAELRERKRMKEDELTSTIRALKNADVIRETTRIVVMMP